MPTLGLFVPNGHHQRVWRRWKRFKRLLIVESGYGSHRAQACLLPACSFGVASAGFILECVANIERLVRDEQHQAVTVLGGTVIHRHPLGEPDEAARTVIPVVGPQGPA